MLTAHDYLEYHENQQRIRALIESKNLDGDQSAVLLLKAWSASEEIKNKNGGMPPIIHDLDAAEQEIAEAMNERGTR